MKGASTKPYTSISYSRVTNRLDFEGHGFWGQGHDQTEYGQKGGSIHDAFSSTSIYSLIRAK